LDTSASMVYRVRKQLVEEGWTDGFAEGEPGALLA